MYGETCKCYVYCRGSLNAVDGSNPYTYTGHSGIVNAVAWSPDGTRIASGSLDSTVQEWQAI